MSRMMGNRLAKLGLRSVIEPLTTGRQKRLRKVKFKEVEIGPDEYRFLVDSSPRNLPWGVNEVMIQKDPDIAKMLSLTVGKIVTIHLELGRGLWINVQRRYGLHGVPVYCEYKTVYNEFTANSSKYEKTPLAVPIGMSAGRQLEVIDLEDDKTPHLLVGGTTGGGKTGFLHTLICGLIRLPPEELRLALFDFKKHDLTIFYKKLPHLLYPIVTNPGDFHDAIQAVFNEMERREDLLEAAECDNIRTYNRRLKPEDRIPQWVIIVDEMADALLASNLKRKKDSEVLISRIGAKARACGIHLVLCTQSPRKEVVTQLVKTNLPGKLAFFCTSIAESMILIDSGDAAFRDAVPVGRSIMARGRLRFEVQIAWCSPTQRQRIVKDVLEGRTQEGGYIHHDVTIGELAEHALNDHNGEFRPGRLFDDFKHRGITLQEIEDMARRHVVGEFDVNGTAYVLRTNGKTLNVIEAGISRDEEMVIMLASYALNNLDGVWSIYKLYNHFRGKITQADIRRLGSDYQGKQFCVGEVLYTLHQERKGASINIVMIGNCNDR